jgi:hypothetical protein
VTTLRAEASVDVVVNYADVLHKGVDARRPDEAEPLGFQLLGERLGAGSRRWQVGDGRRFFPASVRLSHVASFSMRVGDITHKIHLHYSKSSGYHQMTPLSDDR